MGLLNPESGALAEYDSPQTLEAQFYSDSARYILEHARYLRSVGGDNNINRARQAAIEAVDSVLDRYIDAGLLIADYGE